MQMMTSLQPTLGTRLQVCGSVGGCGLGTRLQVCGWVHGPGHTLAGVWVGEGGFARGPPLSQLCAADLKHT